MKFYSSSPLAGKAGAPLAPMDLRQALLHIRSWPKRDIFQVFYHGRICCCQGRSCQVNEVRPCVLFNATEITWQSFHLEVNRNCFRVARANGEMLLVSWRRGVTQPSSCAVLTHLVCSGSVPVTSLPPVPEAEHLNGPELWEGAAPCAGLAAGSSRRGWRTSPSARSITSHELQIRA